VRLVQTGPAIGLLAQLVILLALAESVGLTGSGWVVGMTCGLITNAGLTRGLARHADHDADHDADHRGGGGLRPADRVTLTRATLAGAVAALTADSFGRPAPMTALVALTVIALVLDAVDGWVARRTETASPLGAQFDMEVDAFLILVLSVYVSRSSGVWVLAIGAARYLLLAAGWLLPWLRESVPPRYWRKVVAAIQGIVLTFAMADVLSGLWADAALAAALALLAESFGRDIWGLWRRRRVAPGPLAIGTAIKEPYGSLELSARRGGEVPRWI
jgi:phosphatidylglycerophosphate synthase